MSGYTKSTRTPVEQDLVPNFGRVIEIAKHLDIDFRVTGGTFITHEFYCTHQDFQALIELANPFMKKDVK